MSRRGGGTSWARFIAKRGTKYNARRVYRWGRWFDSEREANRYDELQLLEAAGEIRDLQCQVSFPCVLNEVKVCNYIADFVYYDCRSDEQVVEDVKGMKTPIYKLKKRIMRAFHGIEILET